MLVKLDADLDANLRSTSTHNNTTPRIQRSEGCGGGTPITLPAPSPWPGNRTRGRTWVRGSMSGGPREPDDGHGAGCLQDSWVVVAGCEATCGMRTMRQGCSRDVSTQDSHATMPCGRDWLVELEEPQKERSDSVAFDTQRLDGRDSGIGIGTGTEYLYPIPCVWMDDSVQITAESETALKGSTHLQNFNLDASARDVMLKMVLTLTLINYAFRPC